MTPILTVLADAVGILGGWFIAVYQLQVPSSQYWKSIIDGLYPQDAWVGLIKPIFFGFAIMTIACHVGMQTRGGTHGVGRATTRTVVTASVSVLALNFFLQRILIDLLY